MPKTNLENKVEIGALQPDGTHIYDVSLPLSLDSINYPQLKLINIKAWYLFMSIVREATPEEYRERICSYTFPALEFAKMMNMRQPRGERVNNALAPLAAIPIKIIDGDGIDIDCKRIISTTLITRLEYNGNQKGKPITLWIEPIINDLIFHSKARLDFEYQNIAMLNTVAAIHVFTILRRLYHQHINSISLKEFKERLGVQNRYKRFTDFERMYITPVEEDIRQHTPYKDFRFIYHTRNEKGKKVKVKTLFFEFDSPKRVQQNQELLDNISDKLSGRISKEFMSKAASFDPLTQEVLIKLSDAGYAVNTYMNLILKVISKCSEAVFRNRALDIMADAGKKKSTLGSKYGKILTKELKLLLSKKPDKKELIHDAVQRQSFADQQTYLKAFRERAKSDARKMSVDERHQLVDEYENRIKEFMKDPSMFNRNDILRAKPDARRASFRAFVEFLMDAYRTGLIHIQPTLF